MDCCKNLKNLVKKISDYKIFGTLNREITGLTHDSRNCTQGNIFFAIHGIHYDGHAYIDSAINKGACVIIYSEPLSQYADGITYIKTNSVYESLSRISSNYYRNPSSNIKVIGITGTDGKTSTSDYIYQLLTLTKRKTSLLSSVWQDNGAGKICNKKHITTPDAIEVQKFLYESVHNGCEFAIVEASSHGLSNDLQRLADVSFTLSICTNITSDHLDFHKTRSSYIDAKMNVFRQLIKKSGISIIPYDADWANNVLSIIEDHSRIYSWKVLEENTHDPNEASYVLTILENNKSGILLQVKGCNINHTIKTPFPFPIQINNFAPALITLLLLSDPNSILPDSLFQKIKPIPGRFNIFDPDGSAAIVFDFAHTESAFHAIFSNMRNLYPKRDFISVFGSAGCRDTSKREHLGRIAAQYCSIIILTDEDPREEDSLTILQDIRSGIPENFPGTTIIQPDRRKAIKTAIQLSNKDDMIFCLGKGHETSIEKDGILHPWNEEQIILELCRTEGET